MKNYRCPSGLWKVYGQGGGAGFVGGVAVQYWTALGIHETGRVIEVKGWSWLVMAGLITSAEFAFSFGEWRNLKDSRELEGFSLGVSGGAGFILGLGGSLLRNLRGKGIYYCAEMPFRPRVPRDPQIKTFKIGFKGVGTVCYSKIISCKLRSTKDINSVVKELNKKK